MKQTHILSNKTFYGKLAQKHKTAATGGLCREEALNFPSTKNKYNSSVHVFPSTDPFSIINGNK